MHIITANACAKSIQYNRWVCEIVRVTLCTNVQRSVDLNKILDISNRHSHYVTTGRKYLTTAGVQISQGIYHC